MRDTRGQTMVMLVLTLFLLTLMVCMTIGISVKAKEKMETQTVADAAAYSNAVITARTFNAISLMNRVAVSHLVSMAATQAAISFASSYRAYLGKIHEKYKGWEQIYQAEAVSCCATCFSTGSLCTCCTCAKAGQLWANNNKQKAQSADSFLDSQWLQYDRAAAMEAASFQGSVDTLHLEQVALFAELMSPLDGLMSNKMTQKVMCGAQPNGPCPGGELVAADPGSFGGLIKGLVNLREVGAYNFIPGAPTLPALPIPGVFGGGGAAVYERPASMKYHHVAAVMGSRGNPFVTNRSGADVFLTQWLNSQSDPRGAVITPDNVLIVRHIGATNFHTDTSANGGSPTDSVSATANDDGTISVNWAMYNQAYPPGGAGMPCFMPPIGSGIPDTVTAEVIAGDSVQTVDYHRWSPSIGPKCPADGQVSGFHTMGSCTDCPGMWPMFTDYNFLNVMNPMDNYGQPKLFGMVARDYTQRGKALNYTMAGQADPWNLFFRFRFRPANIDPQQTFDNRGIVLADGTDVSNQVALSTAVAYYHHWSPLPLPAFHGWADPPNFMNPWWRATLVGGKVASPGLFSTNGMPDQQWSGDVGYQLGGAKYKFAKDAYNALKAAGYKGWL